MFYTGTRHIFRQPGRPTTNHLLIRGGPLLIPLPLRLQPQAPQQDLPPPLLPHEAPQEALPAPLAPEVDPLGGGDAQHQVLQVIQRLLGTRGHRGLGALE